MGKNGEIAGVTSAGGSRNHGTIYKLVPPAVAGGAWTHKILHNFTGGTDGGEPVMSLVHKDGKLYGLNYSGGSCNNPGDGGCGTIFELAP